MPKLIYDVNGAYSIYTPPIIDYAIGTIVPISIAQIPRETFRFISWNTLSNGTGVIYLSGSKITIGATDITLYAIYKSLEITLTIDSNGADVGVPKAPETHIGNSAYFHFDAFSIGTAMKYNHKFRTYNSKADGTGTVYDISIMGGSLLLLESLYLYAQWLEIDSIIYYNPNDGTDYFFTNAKNSNYYPKYLRGTKVLVTEIPIRENCTFITWNTNRNGYGLSYPINSVITLDTSVTLYAQWHRNNYTLTYDGNGYTSGTLPSTLILSTITLVTLSSDVLVRTNCNFLGWSLIPDGELIIAPLLLDTDIKVYAKWEFIQCTLTYDGNGCDGGVVPNAITADIGTIVSIIGLELYKNNICQIGWATTLEGNILTNLSELILNKDITLYAIWGTISLYFDSNGATSGVPPPTLQYTRGFDSNTFLSNEGTLLKPGYFVTGWSKYPDGSGVIYFRTRGNFDDSAGYYYLKNIRTDITLYAVWEPIVNININYNGGDANIFGNINDSYCYPYRVLNFASTLSFSSISTMAIKVAMSNIMKDDFYISSLNTQPDGEGVKYLVTYDATNTYYSGYSFLFLNVKESLYLYAQWSPIPKIIYDGNGNTDGLLPITQLSEVLIPLIIAPCTFVKYHYKFSYWSYIIDGVITKYDIGDSIILTKDITLYAQWDYVNIIVFNTDGVIEIINYTSTTLYETLIPIIVPVKNFYDFIGWNTSIDGSGFMFKPDEVLKIKDEDIILYAIWADKYTISFNMGTTFSLVPNTTVYLTRDIINNINVVYYGGNTDYIWTEYITDNGNYYRISFNTLQDGNGLKYNRNDVISLLNTSVVLYAQYSPCFLLKYIPSTENIIDEQYQTKVYFEYYMEIPNTKSITDEWENLAMFSHWNTAVDGSGTNYTEGSKVYGNLDLYAIYTTAFVSLYLHTYYHGDQLKQSKYFYNTDVVLQYTYIQYPQRPQFVGLVDSPLIVEPPYVEIGSTIHLETSDVNFYAVYIPVFSVNFSYGTSLGATTDLYIYNGIIVSFTSYYYEAGTEITIPVNPYTLANHTFKHWRGVLDDANNTTLIFNVGDKYIWPNRLAQRDSSYELKLTAIWEYSALLTYQSNGAIGTPPTAARFPVSMDIIVEDNTLTKDHCVFLYWNTETDGSGISYYPNDNIILTEDTTLYAIFKYSPRLEYWSNSNLRYFEYIEGGSTVIVRGSGLVINDNYYFKSWSRNGVNYLEGDTFVMPSDTDAILLAEWIPYNKLILSYGLTGFQDEILFFKENSNYTLLDLKVVGKVFKHWINTSTYEIYLYGDIIILDSNGINLRAVWVDLTSLVSSNGIYEIYVN